MPGRVVHGVEPVIERGLRGKEIYKIVRLAVVPARDGAVAVGEMPFVPRPDKAVVQLVGRVFRAAQKVGVLLRGVTGNEVEYNLNALGVRRLDKLVEILFRAEPRRRLKEIAHVVPAVHERRIVVRVEPNRVAAERFDIIELARNAFEIAVSVAVGVEERIGINLVKYRGFEPSA